MIIFKKFQFESAHFLPNVPKGHKCGNIHGHSYKLEVFIEGVVDVAQGWVVDFSEISKIVKDRVVRVLDHKTINDYVPNPTCELLLLWIRNEIAPQLPVFVKLKKLILFETETCGALLEE